MKVALLCFLLFAVCFAQSTPKPLSLSSVETDTADRHTEFAATIEDVLIRSGCQVNVHRVSNVRTSGPLNSGVYFMVTIDNQSNQSLQLTFGTPDDDDDDENELFLITEDDGGSINGVVGTCNSGTSCSFVYVCELYPAESTLEVTVFTGSDQDDSDERLAYELTVTEYVEEVDRIGRSFTESGVTVNYDSDAIGPINYAQYYHELDTTLAENSPNSPLYVIVSDFDETFSGDVAVCVSFDSIISNTSPSSANGNTPENELNPDQTDTVQANDNECVSFCQSADIESSEDFVVLAIDLCDRQCSDTNMWIGIQPEDGVKTGYTINIRPDAEALPVLIQVDETPFIAEGEVSGSCEVSDFDYSCDNYFVINSDTDFDAPSDSRLGPFLSVTVFGPLAGSIDVELSFGTLGGENTCGNCGQVLPSACSTLLGSADVACVYTVPPCEFDSELEYVVTVTGDSAQFGSAATVPQPIDYGIEIKLDSYSVEDVNPISTVFGEAVPGQQNHYTVTFEEDEISPDSYFEVELYVRNSDGQNVALAWNFDEPAGGPTTCFQNMGICETNLECEDFGSPLLAQDAVPGCRFVYEDCAATTSEKFARTGDPSFEDDLSEGLRVSQLRAGTYWFNVYHTSESDSFDNVDYSVEYTLKFNLRRSVPVFDNLVVLGQVYFAESTPQYVFNIPNTPGVREIVITIDNVRNGGVTAYVECGGRAGTCPCGDSLMSLAAVSGTSGSRDQLVVPLCECDSETLNIAVVGTTSPTNGDGTVAFSKHQPIFFTMSVDTFASELEVLPLPATRAGTTASGTVSQYGSPGLAQRTLIRNDVFLYELTFDNVDIQSNDALFVTLDVIVETDEGATGGDDYLILSVGESPVYDENFCGQEVCIAASSNEVGSTVRPFNTVGYFSTCTIDLQPCVAGCGTREPFDATRRYIVSVTTQDGIANEDRILFSVTAQVVGNVPVPLQQAVPVRAEQLTKQYNHFSFDVSGSPANSRLVMEAYTNAATFPMTFFANYYSGVGTPIPAGLASDCFDQSFCYTCTIGYEANNRCGYEVPPCVLSEQEGTYFLSVNNEESATQVVNGGVIDQSSNSLPYSVDFTIVARYFPMIDVVEAEQVLVGSIAPYESAYYRINVPQGDLDILRLEFEATSENVRYSVSTRMPDEQCAGCTGFTNAALGVTQRTIFYPCDLPDETLYLTVTTDASLDSCDRYDFIVHAHTERATQRSVSLLSNTTNNEFVTSSYDSTFDDEDELVLNNREFVVYEFSARNVRDGDFLVIEAQQDGDLTDRDYAAYLSKDTPFFPSASVDDLDLADENLCGSELVECSASSGVCRMVLPPCQFDSGTYFITFSGDQVPVGVRTNEINIKIRQFGVITLEEIPSSDASVAVNTFDDESEFDFVGFRSFVTPSLGIAGGDSLEFDINGGSLFLARGSEVDNTGSCEAICDDVDSCELLACENISSAQFYVFVTVGDTSTDVDITITRTESESDSDLSIESLSNGVTRSTVVGSNDEFQYYSFSVSGRGGSQSGRYSFEFNGINENDIFFVEDDDTVFFPGQTTTTDQFTLRSDGQVGTTCGTFQNSALLEGTCCYEALNNVVFAVVGANSDYDITLVEEDFGDQPRSLSSGRSQSGSITADPTTGTGLQFDQYTFTVENGENFLYTLEVTAGSADLFINQGTNAGSDSSLSDDPSQCYQNLGSNGCSDVDSGDTCLEYIPVCDSIGCATDGERTYTIAIVPADTDNDLEYTLTLNTFDAIETIDNNESLRVPSFDDADILGDTGVDTISGLESVFLYELPSSVFTANTLPRGNNLDSDVQDFYPRLEFNFTNFQNSAGDAEANDVNIRYRTSACGPTEPLSALCSALLDDNDDYIQCQVDTCDLACDFQEIYFVVTSNVAEGTEFDFRATELYDDIDEETFEFEFVTSTLNAPGQNSGSFSNQDTAPIETVFIPVSFSRVEDGDYTEVTVSFDEGDGRFTLSVYNANTCGSDDAETICEDIDAGGSCTVVSDPCTTGSLGLFGDNEFVFEISRDSGTGDWGYELEIALRNVLPVVDRSATELSPSGTTRYFATQEITELEWQFYEFVVTPNDGYTTLTVDVDGFTCQSDNGDIEVYFSWDADTDVARPSRFPTQGCFVDSGTNASGSATLDTCKFHGGIYRVGVFAVVDSQLFDDDDDNATDVTNIEALPVQYSISAELTTLSHIQATLGCSLVQTTDLGFVRRIEIPVEATNRYSTLVFGLENDLNADLTLTVGRSGYPEGEGPGCTLGDTTALSGVCSTSGNLCLIEIPSCAYADGLWFAYISGPLTLVESSTSTVTFYSYIDQPYIPVYDMAVSPSVDITATLPVNNNLFGIATASDEYVQYYEINFGEGSYEVIVESANACAGSACTFTVGYLYDETNPSGVCQGDDCTADLVCSITSSVRTCSQIFNTCEYRSVMLRLAGASELCEFNLRVNRFAPDITQAIVVTPDAPSCDISGCNRLYELRPSNGNIADQAFSFEIENNSGQTIEYYFGSNFDCQDAAECLDGETCGDSYGGCKPTDGPFFVYVSVADCFQCLGTELSVIVRVTLDDTSFTGEEIDVDGSPLSTETSQARFDVPSNSFVSLIGDFGSYVLSSSPVADTSTCGDCARIISGGDDGQSVFVQDAQTGFEVRSVDIESLSTGEEFLVSFEADSPTVYFSYDVPVGAQSITVDFTNINTGASSEVPSIQFVSGIDELPSTCNPVCEGSNELTQSACGAFNSQTLSMSEICGAETVYFYLEACELACPVSMTVVVSSDTEVAESIDGDNHNADFTTITIEDATGLTCGPTGNTPNLNFVVEVTDILFVSVREPVFASPTGDAIPPSTGVTAAITQCGVGIGSCTATQTSEGHESSCAIPEGDCNDYCIEAGIYEVSFTTPDLLARFEYQIITEWVDLTSTTSDSLYGEAAHFYRISDADQALSIELTITSGPAVEFTVREACSDAHSTFIERQVCHFGTCHVWLPTKAKNPGQSALYVVIESGLLTATENDPLANGEFEKATNYQIRVTRGTANCRSAPTSGFCSDASLGGVNAFASLSNTQVWGYSNFTAKQDQAQCFYERLLQGCPTPSGLCREYLKTYACLNTFPQCDANGYQMGVCNDICLQIEQACGSYELIGEFPGLVCGSGRLAPASNGTCVTGLPINGSLDTNPLQPARRLEAVAEVDVLPAQLIVPQFPPLYATLPTLVLDDDEDAKMLVQKKVMDSSSASSLTIAFALLAVALLAF